MKKIFRKIKRIKKFIFILIFLPVLFFAYKGFFPKKAEPSYSVIEEIKKGDVKTSINATGSIIAAQKLDLDVYKRSARINTLNVKNGSNLKKGDLILSFDKGDILNNIRSAELSVAQAKLALKNQKITNSGKNSDLESLQNDLHYLVDEINRQEQILGRAKRSYLSENLDVEPHKDDYEKLIIKNKPEISGTYHGDLGEYEIEVYASSADSGFSFQTRGLEGSRGSIFFDKKVDLGTKGLSISFSSDVRSGDTWVLSIPNKNRLENADAADSYDDRKREIEKVYKNNLIRKESLEKQIIIEQNNNEDSIKSLRMAEKESDLARAYQELKDAQKLAEERSIIAPFDGTITGMRNVVEGTKPRNDSEDPVVLGKLVSHDYFVSFSLSLNDVVRVQEGQELELKIPALPLLNDVRAHITEIDILPKNEGLAQYEVRALVDSESLSKEFSLREGLSADIKIIQEEKQNILRVPKVALTYDETGVSILKLLNKNNSLEEEIEMQGGFDLSQYSPETEKKYIQIGLEGKNYVEVVSGLNEGDYIISTLSVKKTESLFGSEDEFEEEF